MFRAAMWLNRATFDTDRAGAWRYDFFAKYAFLLVLVVQSIFGLRITWEVFFQPVFKRAGGELISFENMAGKSSQL